VLGAEDSPRRHVTGASKGSSSENGQTGWVQEESPTGRDFALDTSRCGPLGARPRGTIVTSSQWAYRVRLVITGAVEVTAKIMEAGLEVAFPSDTVNDMTSVPVNVAFGV
jgi:hypothetical protein